MRWRPALSLGVIAALAVAVWAALSSGDEEAPASTTTATTTAFATSTSPPTTTTAAPPTTATTVGTTSSTAAPDTTISPEARLEEVRLILEDLYYRWFDAIYHNNEEAVREVIATDRYLEDFHRSVDSLDLPTAPDPEDVRISGVEVLFEDEQCLVTYSTLDLSAWRGPDAVVHGVNVLLKSEGAWKLGTAWTNRSDLWQSDCKIEPEL